MQYLTVEDIIEINEEILGGAPALRDLGMLESAVMRPQASAFGEDAYPTLMEKAGALMHSLVLNHPFVDGNKRTATIALVDFLEINGFRVIWQRIEALEFITEIAQSKHNVAEIATWLNTNTKPLA
jgi:death-on-curing protein